MFAVRSTASSRYTAGPANGELVTYQGATYQLEKRLNSNRSSTVVSTRQQHNANFYLLCRIPRIHGSHSCKLNIAAAAQASPFSSTLWSYRMVSSNGSQLAHSYSKASSNSRPSSTPGSKHYNLEDSHPKGWSHSGYCSPNRSRHTHAANILTPKLRLRSLHLSDIAAHQPRPRLPT